MTITLRMVAQSPQHVVSTIITSGCAPERKPRHEPGTVAFRSQRRVPGSGGGNRRRLSIWKMLLA
jgi:hypothetical protein